VSRLAQKASGYYHTIMKIFYTANSPFARIARIAAHTCNVQYEPVCLKHNELRTNENSVLKYNCTGRVPTLVDNEIIVTETGTICRYLEAKGDGTKLFNTSGDWKTQQIEGIALSFLDGCALWAREHRRPNHKQSAWLCEVERDRAARCLDWFSRSPGIMSISTLWDFPHIVLTVAISFLHHRELMQDWQKDRCALVSWHLKQCERPSVLANPIVLEV